MGRFGKEVVVVLVRDVPPLASEATSLFILLLRFAISARPCSTKGDGDGGGVDVEESGGVESWSCWLCNPVGSDQSVFASQELT